MSLSLLLPLSCTFSFHFSFVRSFVSFLFKKEENAFSRLLMRIHINNERDEDTEATKTVTGEIILYFIQYLLTDTPELLFFSLNTYRMKKFLRRRFPSFRNVIPWLLEKPDGIWCFWRDKSLVRHKSACLCSVKYPKVMIIFGASVLGVFVVLWFCFVVIVITDHYCYYHHYYQFIIIVIITIII